jgi:mannitol/fructose-specific phosphotransferase system IIA component (Ntr-type)
VKAEIIFLLALNDPKQQVPWLKKMAALFKNQTMLKIIRDIKDPQELVEILKSMFLE